MAAHSDGLHSLIGKGLLVLRRLATRPGPPRSKKTAVGSFEDEASEAPGRVGAGIDPDPIRHHFRLGLEGMAVHDDFAMEFTRTQKLISDPDQVGVLLLI